MSTRLLLVAHDEGGCTLKAEEELPLDKKRAWVSDVTKERTTENS